MNNINTTRLLVVTAATVASLCMYSDANAQYNGSNSSGTNTTSFGGTSNSIWNSDRAPVEVKKVNPVVVTVPEDPGCPGEITPIPTPIQKLIPPVSTDKPAGPKYRKPYPKATKAKPPRARG